jgi:hypothetical protein
MRTRYVWDPGARWPDGRQGAWAVARARGTARAAGPAVISDSLADMWNPADGRTYDSKSAYYRAVRAAGCEIAGNEPMGGERPDHRAAGLAQDIKRAMGRD